MATLEKIRSKSVLLLIIIAVALLAFILGDFFNSGRSFFGQGTTIAKVDGTKIDINDFQRKLEEANQQVQRSGQKVDSSVLQEQVLEQLVMETLFNNEVEALGLTVTDNELSDAMLGQNAAGFDRMIQQQYGIESAAALHDMAFNPNKYQLDAQQAAQLRQIWVNLEKDVEQTLLYQKFNTLFAGVFVANNLDAKAMYDDNAKSSTIAFAKKDYSTLEDDKYTPTNEEIEAYWQEHKNRYRLDEPVRFVDYIAVEIAPSAADQQAGRKRVETALAGLRDKEGIEGLNGMTDMVSETKNYTASAIKKSPLKAFVDSASVGKAAVVRQTGNDFLLAKLLNVTTDVDSVNIDFLAVQGSAAQVDSLVNALNNGAPLAEVANNPLVAGSQDSSWVSLTDPQLAALKQTLVDAPTNRFFTPDSLQDGGRIFRIRSRKAPVTVYNIATVDYTIEPSAATINTLQGDLARYVNANKTAKEFAENAVKAGYTLQNARLTPSSPQLGRLDESRSAVAWAFDAKKGQVSEVLGDETSGRFIAVALEDIYSNGFTPASDPQLREDITTRVLNQKKGAALTEQFKGKAKNVEGFAQAMSSKVDTAQVAFGQMFIPGIGVNEGALQAAVATSKPGQLVGPLAANNAVVVFTITNVNSDARPFNADEQAAIFTQQRGANRLGQNMFGVLKGNKKVDNKILKFYK